MTTVHVGEPPIHPMVAPYANAPTVAFDTETSSLFWWENTFWIGGYVLYAPGVGPTYIPVGHETMFDVNEDKMHVASSIQRLADDPNRHWLMHNRVFDENVVKSGAGINFKGKITDTIGLWWTINSFARSFALKRLGVMVDPTAATQETKLKDFIEGNKLKRYTQVPAEMMRPYAEQDGVLTYKLWELGMKKLPAHQTEVHEMEQQWIGLLSRMSRVGLPVDAELCQSIIDTSLSKAHQVRLKLAKMTGIRGFNPGSAAQVQRAAAALGVKLLNDSTEMASLWASGLPKEMRDGIIEYRQLVHTVGSYLEPFLHISRNAFDNRVHTTFRTTTDTGRLAAGDPINLQGLPRSGNKIHRVREAVKYTEESGLGRAYLDYAQIDVRLGTHYSQDRSMTEVMTDPKGDVHTMVMNEIRAMKVNIDRPNSKRLVFGSQYMVGPDKFAATASGLDEDGEYQEISRETASVWLKAHRKRFPAFPWISSQVESILKQRGHIWLWDGKQVILQFEDDPFKGFAWLVQGGGAQVIKRAMVGADKELRAGGYASVLALQVHDEVHVEGPLEELAAATNLTARHMAYVWPQCRVPLYVQPEIGAPSWAKKEKFGEMVPASVEAWRLDSKVLAAV